MYVYLGMARFMQTKELARHLTTERNMTPLPTFQDSDQLLDTAAHVSPQLRLQSAHYVTEGHSSSFERKHLSVNLILSPPPMSGS